jgi:DNA mismatch endonuclease, patch repair protein
MSQIKGKNTMPEISVRKFLFKSGLRYKLHDSKLPGTPDIVLPKYKTVIFVNGCFWHGHKGCKKFVIPKTRTDFWLSKIQTNISNEKKNVVLLNKKGWKVLTVWECQLKKQETFYKILQRIKT